jgi:hypothetical protein
MIVRVCWYVLHFVCVRLCSSQHLLTFMPANHTYNAKRGAKRRSKLHPLCIQICDVCDVCVCVCDCLCASVLVKIP